jgi:hypothetical protein
VVRRPEKKALRQPDLLLELFPDLFPDLLPDAHQLRMSRVCELSQPYLRLRGRRGSGRIEWAASSSRALAELFTFFRSHLLPALGHSPFPSFGHAPSHIGANRATGAKASEQNPAESQQTESLPEINFPPSEQLRREPVPQMHHNFAANYDDNSDAEQGQRGYKNHFLSHVVLLTSS